MLQKAELGSTITQQRKRSVQSQCSLTKTLQRTNSLSTEDPGVNYWQNQNFQVRISKTFLLLLFLMSESHLHVFSSNWKVFILSVDPLYCHTFSNKTL